MLRRTLVLAARRTKYDCVAVFTNKILEKKIKDISG